jgi:ParB/RepB/Spo0J family partition protein
MTRSAVPRKSAKAVAASTEATAQDSATLRRIAVDRIDLPKRPIRRFLGDIAALAESMQEYGLQQPVSVRVNGDRFILTSGMRRLAGARLLQWTTIPAFVRTVSADEAYLVDLVENLQREDLSPEEEADAFGELIRARGWTLQQVADSVKRSVGYISKRVRVFEDAELRQAIVSSGLPVSTAEELLAAALDQRGALIERALVEHWDQTQAREALRAPDELPTWLQDSTSVDELELAASADDADGQRPSQQTAVDPANPEVRPRGFTRVVRDFHRLLTGVRAEHLTVSDRAALRALFRDLLLLARAPKSPTARVFPPLPTAPERGRRARPDVSNAAARRASRPNSKRA